MRQAPTMGLIRRQINVWQDSPLKGLRSAVPVLFPYINGLGQDGE